MSDEMMRSAQLPLNQYPSTYAAVQRIVELEAEIAALKAKHVATPSSHPEIPDNSKPVARVTGYYGGRCVIEPLDGMSIFPTGMAVYTRGMRELSDEEIIAVADAMDQFSLMLQDEIVRFARAIIDAALAAARGDQHEQ